MHECKNLKEGHFLVLIVSVTTGCIICSGILNHAQIALIPLAVVVSCAMVWRPWLGLIVIMALAALGDLQSILDLPFDLPEVAGCITGALALVLFLKKRLRYRKTPLDAPLALLVFAMVLSLFPALNINLKPFLRFLLILGMYVVAVHLMDSREKVETVLSSFFVLGSLVKSVTLAFFLAQEPTLSIGGIAVKF